MLPHDSCVFEAAVNGQPCVVTIVLQVLFGKLFLDENTVLMLQGKKEKLQFQLSKSTNGVLIFYCCPPPRDEWV